MSENHSALRIHTTLRPETAAPQPKIEKVPRARLRRAKAPAAARERPGFSDRLLRNSAIACALLLGVLALGNIDQPWAEKAASGIEQALTMRINLDDSIGDLTFVREIMPESALVFLNVSGSAELTLPVDGELLHPWSEVQPWLLFSCGEGDPVFAAGAGTVTAVSPLSDGRYGLLIDHGDGQESVYANLESAAVQSGDAVTRGQQLGVVGDSLYYEYRSSGEPIDPTEKLGL